MIRRYLRVSSILIGMGLIAHARAAVCAEPLYPISIAAAADGTIYLADRDLPGIWKISGGTREVLFQGSRRNRTPLNAIRCVAVDAKGRLVAGDTATREIYRFNSEGQPEPLSKAGIGMPMAIAFARNGEILVCNLEIHQVVKVPEAGGEPVKVADIQAPKGIAVDAQDRIWIVSQGKNQVVRILPDGSVETVIEGKPFEYPHNIALDNDLNAYVSDGYAKAIWKIPAGGKPEKLVAGGPLQNPVGLTWHGDRLLVVDPRANGIFMVALDGKLTPVPIKGP